MEIDCFYCFSKGEEKWYIGKSAGHVRSLSKKNVFIDMGEVQTD